MNAIYPPREGYKTSGFGYASDMIHLAVNRDDPEGFMKFLDECGGPTCEALVAGSIWNYAAIHGAAKCLQALHDSGATSQKGVAYWLKVAERPVYGPRVKMLSDR